MKHLRLGTVVFAFLGVFTWHMKINMTQIPPIRKSLGIVNPPPPPSLTWHRTIQSYKAILIQGTTFIEGLCDSQRMSFDRKGIPVNHVLPRTRGIFVFHPMQVNTFGLVGIIGDATISL